MNLLPDRTCFRIDTLDEYGKHVDSLRQSYLMSLPTPTPPTCLSTGCYHFLSGPITWMQAKTSCEEMNMRLVEIETEEENRALTKEALKVLGSSKAAYLWIGLTDRAREGTWVWNSGKEPTYTAWRSSSREPNDYKGSEDCALHYFQSHGGWNDWDCEHANHWYSGPGAFGAICELLK